MYCSSCCQKVLLHKLKNSVKITNPPLKLTVSAFDIAINSAVSGVLSLTLTITSFCLRQAMRESPSMRINAHSIPDRAMPLYATDSAALQRPRKNYPDLLVGTDNNEKSGQLTLFCAELCHKWEYFLSVAMSAC